MPLIFLRTLYPIETTENCPIMSLRIIKVARKSNKRYKRMPQTAYLKLICKTDRLVVAK
jgi:hypothetical protein